jgi:hypothetical protein
MKNEKPERKNSIVLVVKEEMSRAVPPLVRFLNILKQHGS